MIVLAIGLFVVLGLIHIGLISYSKPRLSQ
jgi:hypothetical protein